MTASGAAGVLPVAVALPFVAAALLLPAWRALGRRAAWLVVAAAVGSTALLLAAAGAADTPRFVRPWLPGIDVAFALRGDPFGLFLALLVAGVGALVAVYAVAYLADEPDDRVRRFWPALATFMGAMLGIALADDLILLFVFWEITSISSFLLIGYRSEDDDARTGALTALQVTVLGGLAMSVGFLLIGQVTGTFSIGALESSSELTARLCTSPAAPAVVLLVLAGAFTKSAQVPFHFWLARAMVAPTPISAYLHAATMVKAGVFLVGRMQPILGDAPGWAPLLIAVGGTTMVLGAWQALHETDLKGVLARTTGSALGSMMLVYGIGAAEQDALHILNHALYKGALFLVAGIVEHHAHTRDLRRLGGLRPVLPLAFVACMLAALSMAGIPPLLGFVSKEAVYGAVLASPSLAAHPLLRAAVVTAGILANALLVAVAARITLGVFLGSPSAPTPHGPLHRQPWPPLWIAPLVLALGALVLGLLAATPLTGDLAAAASSVTGAHPHVALVPEVGAALLLSLVTLALGGALYRARGRLARFHWARWPAAADVWDGTMAAIVRLAEWYSRAWQNGSLRWYLAASALFVPVLAIYVLETGGLSYRDIHIGLDDLSGYGVLFCVLLAVATVTAVRARSRLAAAIAMTTVGFLVAMLFVVYRSPDILLTQILIETVSTIFVLLVIIFLPAFPRHDLTPGLRAVNLAVALAFGATLSGLVLLAMTPGFRETHKIANEPGGLLALSLAEGGGANAVNVIIADIRAMDTTGEITVLLGVALCVYGLLRTRRSSV